MAGLLYRLGRFATRRHWYVIVAWVLLLGLSGATYAAFSGPITSSISIPGTATEKVQKTLSATFPKATGGTGTLVFATKNGGAFSATQKTQVKTFVDGLGTLTDVKKTTDPFTQQQQLDDQRQKITNGRQQLAQGTAKLDDAESKLAAGQQQVDQAQKQLDTRTTQGEVFGQTAAAQTQLDAAQQQIDQQKSQLAANQAKLTSNRQKLAAQKTQLDNGGKLLGLAKNIRFVSKDGSAGIATIQFSKSTFDVPTEVKTAIGDKASSADIAGVNVYVSNDIAQGVPSILGPGEVIGVVVAAIALLVLLGTVIAAALPLVSAILGVGVASLAALSFSSLVEFISVTPVLGVMLGLAVGIDYSLFILNRHRTQLKQGIAVSESIGLANGTSGTAVLFAGSTVIIALLALNITGIPFLGLMGTVGAVAVAVAILVALTFTPAVLSVLKLRVLRKKERQTIGTTGATRVPTSPMKTSRAIITLVAGVIVLGTIALPATQMRLGLPAGSSEATDSSQYKAYKTVADKFGPGQNGPPVVVAELPKRISDGDVTARELTVGRKISEQHDVAAVAPIGASTNGKVLAFQVIPKTGPSSAGTETLVKSTRDLTVKVPEGTVTLGVAGNASANIDVSQKLADALPLYLVVVVGLSLIILIIVFRSILVPITATAGFVLSLLAAFGGITAIYQFGWLGAIFGVHDPGPILSFLPIIEVGILFGLAMDYQLFLVSGMREAFAHGSPPKVAVQRGLHAGRAVVAAAAIIMIAVFSGFIFSDSAIIRPIGFGLAFGVLVDAFVVRMLLIPAAMHLLGSSAWWLPAWLEKIIPDVDVEGAKLQRSDHDHDHDHDRPDHDRTDHDHSDRVRPGSRGDHASGGGRHTPSKGRHVADRPLDAPSRSA